MVIDGGSGGPGRADGDSRPRRPRPTRDRRLEQPQTVIRLPKDPYETDYPAPKVRRGRGVLALAALVVLVATVIAVNSRGHGKDAATQGASTGVGGGVPPATASVGHSAGPGSSPAFPSGSTSGVLVGYPDTKEGAESAAANYAAAYGSDLMLDPAKRHAMIQAMADPAIAQALTAQLDIAANAAAKDWGLDSNGNPPHGQSVVDRTAVVGVSATSYDQNKATVAVWVNNIGGMAGVGSTRPVAEQWNTLTINLTWVNSDWKWNSFTEADGPTPVKSDQQVSSSTDLQKATQQFARLRYAP